MIKKIVLDIDGKEIVLTEQQARKLMGDLQSLFADKQAPSIPYLTPYPDPFQKWRDCQPDYWRQFPKVTFYDDKTTYHV